MVLKTIPGPPTWKVCVTMELHPCPWMKCPKMIVLCSTQQNLITALVFHEGVGFLFCNKSQSFNFSAAYGLYSLRVYSLFGFIFGPWPACLRAPWSSTAPKGAQWFEDWTWNESGLALCKTSTLSYVLSLQPLAHLVKRKITLPKTCCCQSDGFLVGLKSFFRYSGKYFFLLFHPSIVSINCGYTHLILYAQTTYFPGDTCQVRYF